MAESDNTGSTAPGEDGVVAIATSLFEARLGIEATREGLTKLKLIYPKIAPELAVLEKFATQVADAFAMLESELAQILPIRGMQA